jgi:hypothetical protein
LVIQNGFHGKGIQTQNVIRSRSHCVYHSNQFQNIGKLLYESIVCLDNWCKHLGLQLEEVKLDNSVNEALQQVALPTRLYSTRLIWCQLKKNRL